MDLSIIIVNWNSKDYLRKCIASILATTKGIDYEIIVIDSASFDGCREMLNQYYPQVRFVQSEKNIGFAKANNAAFLVSHGRNILFLNPDTEPEGNAIETLHRELDSLPNAAIVGAKLLNSDRSIQTRCINSLPTILNQLLDSDLLRKCFPKASLWGMQPLFSENEIPAEVDTVSGACLMIRRSVFESVGMFSQEYFMYSEDIDICYKVMKTKSKIYYVPEAVIVHHGGGSTSSDNPGNRFSNVMLLESRYRFFRKTRSTQYCWLYNVAMLISCTVRIAIVFLIWPIAGSNEKRSSLSMTYQKWFAKLRWVLGGESWVKRF